MAAEGYLPPVVTKFIADLSDLARGVAQAKLLVSDFAKSNNDLLGESGRIAGRAYSAGFTDEIRRGMPAAGDIVDDFNRDLDRLFRSTTVNRSVTVNDGINQGDRDRAGGAATRAGEAAAGGFIQGFTSFLTSHWVAVLVVLAALFLAPPIGALVAGAVALGGVLAFIALGAFGLRADEQLRAAMKKLGATASTTLTEAAQPLKGPFLEAIGIFTEAIQKAGPHLKEIFTIIGPSIPVLAKGVVEFMKAFKDTGALKQLAETAGPLIEMLAMALPDLGNAFSQLIISVSNPETVAAFGSLLRGLADTIRFLGDTLNWLTHQFQGWIRLVKLIGAAFGLIGTAIGLVVTGFQTLWGAMTGNKEAQEAVYAMADSIHNFVVGVKRWLEDLWSAIGTTSATVVGTITSMPEKLIKAAANFGSTLYGAGRNIVTGLIDGMKSRIGDLANMASQLAGTIRNYLPFSPAKEGPLSGSGNPFNSGQMIGSMLAAGVMASLPMVSASAAALAGQFAPGAPGGPRLSADMRPAAASSSASSGPGMVHTTINIDGQRVITAITPAAQDRKRATGSTGLG
jgi:hypothetical protein